jgi:hypothetical protein
VVTLPREWVRGPQWASPAARAAWEPVLRRAQRAWQELEIASVTEGLRAAALVHLTAAEVPQASRDCAGVGLELSVLELQQDATFRAAVHQRGAAAGWPRAWSTPRDDDAIGAMLGFPSCCRAFFRDTWAGRGSRDLTPAMATIEGPWEASIMLRWMGVRLVPHLPCSGRCEETARQARAFLDAGARMGLDVEAIGALLRLPIDYSARNGVAIVETPHFRFMAGADAGVAEFRLVRRGPDEAAPPAPEPTTWEDNGFATEAAMRSAHAVVLAAAAATYSGGPVLDLGCGDGALLEQLRLAVPGTSCYGVESDATRARRGRVRHPRVQLLVDRIEAADEPNAGDEPWELALLMPGRLVEMEAAAAARVRQTLRAAARRLVVYGYGSWLERGGLRAIAAAAGIEIVGEVHRGPGVEAAEGRVAA